ncbi:carbohydrate ABC transporter permease [Ammoniphilus resinae]|uniref:Multiple sugar transport system permease protein n=1 Tax=Ammoniphilus resinae TaxID=861532 RepID=A0ABS4GM55_9BACL|nr:sugar ABC transporter permease [Ammoniphilus resinae]MBP1931355.1 multiple sugar transport system permease protein [Ammoniphilus resinae]
MQPRLEEESRLNLSYRPKKYIKKHGVAYLFMLPAIFFLIILFVLPFIEVFKMSFYSVNLLNPEAEAFIFLDNFISALSDPTFYQYLYQGLIWTFGSVIGEYIVGIVTAILLNQNIRGKTFFRAIIFIPWLVPIVVAAMTWRWILNPDFGIFNVMLVKVGILDESINWLGTAGTAMLAVIFVNVWRTFPFYTVTLLAGLQSIPKEILEAAEIDGAGIWQRFWYIILPSLKGVSAVIIILHVIWTFNNFDFIWLLTEGGPLHATETLAITTYLEAFEKYHFGQASALSSIMILILIGIIIAYFKVEKKQNNG